MSGYPAISTSHTTILPLGTWSVATGSHSVSLMSFGFLSSRDSKYSKSLTLLTLPHNAVLNADVGAAIAHRQRHLAHLAAAAALVEVQVFPQRVDVHQRREKVPR